MFTKYIELERMICVNIIIFIEKHFYVNYGKKILSAYISDDII